jgi:hypothetical protein
MATGCDDDDGDDDDGENDSDDADDEDGQRKTQCCACLPACVKGCATAATMLRLGRGCPQKDTKTAFALDEIACDRGHPSSCHQVRASGALCA